MIFEFVTVGEMNLFEVSCQKERDQWIDKITSAIEGISSSQPSVLSLN
jgi:hypothetical protein